MKKSLTYLIMLILFQQTYSQTLYTAKANLKALDGTSVQLNEMLTSSEGTILIFWETNNSLCSSNIDNLQNAWVENIKELGVDLIAICVNYSGMWTSVKPYISGKGWDFETYIDINGDIKRMLGIGTLPYTILLDGNQKIKCRYPGYCSGDESIVRDKITHCLKNAGNLADLR